MATSLILHWNTTVADKSPTGSGPSFVQKDLCLRIMRM
jgi:hypothetical protein